MEDLVWLVTVAEQGKETPFWQKEYSVEAPTADLVLDKIREKVCDFKESIYITMSIKMIGTKKEVIS